MTNALANNFCSQCGNALVETAVICPKCGSPTSRFNQMNTVGPRNTYNPGVAIEAPRVKSTAVVLAVFLGTWTFLYTYRKDAVVFWVSLGFQTFFFLAILFLAILASRASGASAAFGFIAFIFWLLAVITTATRPSDWYLRYPNN
jgi:hypothetical protein